MSARDDLAALVRRPYALADLICEVRHPDVRPTMTGFAVPGGRFYGSCAMCKAEARNMLDAAATVERVRALAEEWEAEADDDERWLSSPRVAVSEAQTCPATIQQARGHVRDLRAALDGP